MCETVAAIIVTFNRKSLLVKCIDSILSQTIKPEKIIIIDNASSDGTPELLQEKGYLNNQIIDYVRLSENTGGAGGFHEGMKRAYESGYHWLWMMDDDGYPAPNCLEKLLEPRDNLDVVGCAVVLPEDSSKLTWTLLAFNKEGYLSSRKRIRDYGELIRMSENKIYKDYALFFNAVLINRQVIQNIGFVNKELFIRGDEFEYFLRSKSAGINLGTKVDAFYYHPYQPLNLNQMKYFYSFRNTFYNYTKYAEITYRSPMRFFYFIYVFIKSLQMAPSISPQYISQVIKAVCLATKGKLIPYKPVTN